jgi:hypothetical protein
MYELNEPLLAVTFIYTVEVRADKFAFADGMTGSANLEQLFPVRRLGIGSLHQEGLDHNNAGDNNGRNTLTH